MEDKIYKELLEIADNKNIEVIDHMLKSNTISGLYGNYKDVEVISLNVNLKDDLKKRNFILAHELGHAELHKDILNSTLYFNDTGYKNDIEKQADNYAIRLIETIKANI